MNWIRLPLCIASLLLPFGCHDTMTDQLSLRSSSPPGEGTITLFAKLLVDNFETSLDCVADYTEARRFLESIQYEPLKPSDLDVYLENTFRIVRDIRANVHPYQQAYYRIPKQASYLLVALRFVRNASRTVNEAGHLSELSNQYLALAKKLLNENVWEDGAGTRDNYMHFCSTCKRFNLFYDCQTHALRAHVAWFAFHIMLSGFPKDTWLALTTPIRHLGQEIYLFRFGCKAGKSMRFVHQRLHAYFFTITYVLQIPPESVWALQNPIAAFVDLVNEKIHNIYDQIPEPDCL